MTKVPLPCLFARACLLSMLCLHRTSVHFSRAGPQKTGKAALKRLLAHPPIPEAAAPYTPLSSLSWQPLLAASPSNLLLRDSLPVGLERTTKFPEFASCMANVISLGLPIASCQM